MLLAIGHFCIKNVLTFLIWSNSSEKKLIFLLSEMGGSGFFSEPFDQIKKVRTFFSVIFYKGLVQLSSILAVWWLIWCLILCGEISWFSRRKVFRLSASYLFFERFETQIASLNLKLKVVKLSFAKITKCCHRELRTKSAVRWLLWRVPLNFGELYE